MQLEDKGIICDTMKRPESERIAFFTSLCAVSSGSIICTCQIGPAKNAATSILLLFRSRDRGCNWQELGVRLETRFGGVPGSFSSCQIVEVEPGRLLLIATWYDRSDPNRPLFDPITEGLLISKQLKAFSTDDGESWSPWAEIPIPELKGCSSTGPILQWSDGVIAFPFESLKKFDDTNPAVPGAWCVISRDNGKTFGGPVLIARHPENKIFYWDQRLCAGPSPGEFTALFWTHNLEDKSDLPVHLRKASLFDRTLQSAPISGTGIPGQIAAPLLLEDGRLLAFVVNRDRPGTLTLWLSKDRGVSWPEQLVVHVHDERAALTQGAKNIDYVEYWDDMNKWTFGHPAIRSIGNEKVLLSYYAGVPNRLSIYWARADVTA